MFFTKTQTKIVNVFAAAAIAAGAVFSSPAMAYERWIDVENVGQSEIVSIRISNIDDEDWSRNLIRGSYIEAGNTMTVEPRITEGYCRFDMLVEYEDGEQVKVWDINLCEATDIQFDEEGYHFA
jgi:hypothetical protein